jgi:uncharacterized protein (DUF58 family)
VTLAELTSKIRRIEIKSKTLSNHIFAGDYHTAFKGRGMSFSEVREYSYGDDVRSIDWNVSARFGHPYIKVFEEEREMIMMLLIDVSNSSLFGTHDKSKRDLSTEISATLAFSALKNNDKVGAIFFSNGVEQYIEPKKGRSHILFILRTMLTIVPKKNNKTDIAQALQVLNNVCKRKAITFIISDFISDAYEKQLQFSGKKHDVIGIHLFDKIEREIPNVGLMAMQDLETGMQQYLNTSNAKDREMVTKKFDAFFSNTKSTFAKANAGFISMHTAQDYVKILHQYFSR